MNLNNNGYVQGRIVRDVELKENNGRKYAYVVIASQRNYKNKETEKYESDFLTFVATGQKAEFIAGHFAKGDAVQLTYELYSQTKKDEDGKNITTEGKRITEVQFVTRGKANPSDDTNTSGGDEKKAAPEAKSEDFTDISDDDDLPF